MYKFKFFVFSLIIFSNFSFAQDMGGGASGPSGPSLNTDTPNDESWREFEKFVNDESFRQMKKSRSSFGKLFVKHKILF